MLLNLFFPFYDELIRFVYIKWEQRRFLMSYEMVYPRLITSLRWKFDYVFFSEWKMQKCEHELLDRLVDEYLSLVKEKYSERYYHLQITKSKSTYFVNFFFFFWIHFFLFCQFLQQHQNAIKSSNKINTNQWLRLPLLKHTHTHTHHTHTQMIIIIVKTIIIIIIKKRQYQSPSPS